MRGRDLGNALAHRLTLAFLRVRLALQRRWVKVYQPDPFARTVPEGVRDSADRFEAFSEYLPAGPVSVLDVGCNEGYFVFRLAERGGLSIGIDQDRNAVMIAEARARVHGVPNAVFSNMAVTVDNVDALPDADVVILLSVFHHWARHWGPEVATDVLRRLAVHARHGLVFETGHSGELGARWTDALAFMGGYREWVRGVLAECGFSKVVEAGEYATTVSATPRVMFVAVR